jgi:Tol biopolymer transport system component
VGDGYLPVWSPNGARLAFAGTFRQKANYVVRADGTQLHRAGGCTCHTRGPGFIQALSWSPDSSQIAYVGGNGQSIWIVRHDGTRSTLLAAQLSNRHGSPIWPFWKPSRR